MNPSVARLADGGRLAFVVRGDPSTEAPILLHRPLGGSMALWGEFAERLSAELPVIAFDCRGVGSSSDVPWLHSTRAMAQDAVQLLDALGVPCAHVFGLSLGGMVASWMAIDAPLRVSALVLASTLPRPGTVSHRVERHALPMLRCLSKAGTNAEACLVREILSPEFRRDHSDRARAIEETVRREPARRRNLVLLALAAACHDADAALRGNSVRTLLLFGRLDPIAGRASQEALLRDLPNATLEMIDGAGHDVSLEKPAEAAARVIGFLRSECR